jgi:hypothetical protein
MGSSVTFDDDSGGIEARTYAALARAGEDVTEFLLEESNRTVPIEEDTLERSGQAEFDAAEMQGTVSYDTPYAARQHEETGWRHDPGRRAKWLELTFAEQADAVADHLGNELRRALS